MMLKVEMNPSTAYHPQTDGLTERYHQEMKSYLRLYVGYQQKDWAKWLKMAQFSYDNMVHSSHGHTPFYASEGRHPYSSCYAHTRHVTTSPNIFILFRTITP